MENKRDSEIDGCYIVEGILFRSLPHHLSDSLVTIPQKKSFTSVLGCKTNIEGLNV